MHINWVLKKLHDCVCVCVSKSPVEKKKKEKKKLKTKFKKIDEMERVEIYIFPRGTDKHLSSPTAKYRKQNLFWALTVKLN